MKRKTSKFLSLLLAVVLLLSLVAPAALAAENTNTVYLRTAEDLVNLSQNCTLDRWSQGKTVYLEADIDLSGADTTEPVSREELSSACFHERVLIKTRRTAPERWTEDFRSVSPGAVRMLLESGVMLIGLDTPSIDPADSTLLLSHRVALQGGISIIENLDLSQVEAGDYELIALPLKLEGVEASPVRAVLRSVAHR